MAKRIGGQHNSKGDLKIECLDGLPQKEQVQRVANSFAEVSNQFKPVDRNLLPAFLQAEEPPQLQPYQVDQKIKDQKKTKTTLDTDISYKLRKEAAVFLADPLTHVLNESLKQGTFPNIWKEESVTPVPKKKTPPKFLKDVRKIASTSDYSKIYEQF